MRFAEIALLVLPIVVFVAWRLLAPATAGPPKVLVIAVTAAVVAMAGLLLVLWYEEAEPPGVGYVPARLENGRVLPERVVPIAPGQVTSGQTGTGQIGLGQTGPAQAGPGQTGPGQTGPAGSTPK